MNIGISSYPASPVSQTGSSLVPAPQLDISRYAVAATAASWLFRPACRHRSESGRAGSEKSQQKIFPME
jgi:hypothetical protein